MIANAPAWESFSISRRRSFVCQELSASCVSRNPSRWIPPVINTGSGSEILQKIRNNFLLHSHQTILKTETLHKTKVRSPHRSMEKNTLHTIYFHLSIRCAASNPAVHGKRNFEAYSIFFLYSSYFFCSLRMHTGIPYTTSVTISAAHTFDSLVWCIPDIFPSLRYSRLYLRSLHL